ncbi:MAG TPA: phosphatase PAP2 family protein [Rhizomicrobium sp.]|nr:phosphatase PAP2 family protein [Rhizomicrobium sp.]
MSASGEEARCANSGFAHSARSITSKQFFSGLTDGVRRSFAAHIPLYAASAAIFGSLLLLLSFYHVSMPLSSGLFFLKLLAQLLLLAVPLVMAHDLYDLWRSGAPNGLAKILAVRMAERILKHDRFGNGVHAIITLTPMMMVFTVVKENITAINPFSWDKTFAEWDVALGAGHMPWQALQPLLDHPVIVIGFNLLYHLWFAAMFGLLIWQAFSKHATALRLQFLLTFCFVWFFGGSVLAIVFSSAGPCYYADLFAGPSPFAPQMTFLDRIGPDWIWSLAVQRDLWTSYVTGSGTIKGISAMPSMHVTIAVVNALLCWRVDRRLGIAAFVFAALIFLGSIVLLWHYAVDGIAGAVIACLCWAAAGTIVQRWHAYVQRRRDAGGEIAIQSV